MGGIGWVLIAVSAWLIYAGYMGIPPLTTITKVIQSPEKAQEILAASKKPLASNSAGSSIGAGAVAYARAQIGKTYWDKDVGGCGGLVQKAYKSVGVNVSAWAPTLLATGEKVNKKSDLQVGDLVFPSIPGTLVGHVQLYSGNGNIIEATVPGKPVVERAMWGFPGENVRASRPVTK